MGQRQATVTREVPNRQQQAVAAPRQMNCPAGSNPAILKRTPREAFRWGEVLRLRIGLYRIMYTVEGDLITILRVDRRAG